MHVRNFSTCNHRDFRVPNLARVPEARLVYTDSFDDPKLPGEMRVTVTLKAVSVGTEMTVEQQAIPDMIPPEACYLGWQESLRKLTRLVEPDIREEPETKE